MVGMLSEEFFDFGSIAVDLALQEQQLPGPRLRQPAFGAGDGVARCELECLGKKREAFLRRLGSIQPVRVQELLPVSLACLDQRGRRGEALDEAPADG